MKLDDLNREYWVFTIHLPMWRYARDLNIPIIDITVKSGIKAFAPTWDNLNAYRRGELSNEEYAKLYYEKVIPTYRTDPQEWENLTKHKTFALGCYCAPGKFCHRTLFAMLTVTHLQSLGNPVVFQGELVPHPNNRHYYSRSDSE